MKNNRKGCISQKVVLGFVTLLRWFRLVSEKEFSFILLQSDSCRESLYTVNAFIFITFMNISPSLETLRIYKISVMWIGV